MEYLFLLFLFIIAFMYASVGHGGASGYLALMALFSIAPDTMKSTALILNVFVSIIAFTSYYKGGFFKWKIVLPFLITSVPFAFLGSAIHVQPHIYKIVLGVFLLFAVVRILFIPKTNTYQTSMIPVLPALLIGALLGFFSGMIGIGGGIILSPLLIIFYWATIKEAAAASALFIFFNSISGIMGMLKGGYIINTNIVLWVIIGVLGGIAGSYTGSFKLASDKLKYFLAVVLLVASIKLFIV